MKTLKEYIHESLLDDFDAVSSASATEIKNEIKQFLKDNYKKPSNFKISRKPNNDGYYEVDCSKYTNIFTNNNIMSLTNNLFIFVNVKGSFYCSYSRNLTSLEGSPKEVDGDFFCTNCNNLTSLEGSPEKVKGSFNCTFCDNLTSLKGAPKEVGKHFYCYSCKNLTSLEGVPEKVGGKICSDFPD